MTASPTPPPAHQLPIVTEEDLVAARVWRMHPYEGRHERWDLVPVSDLGLARKDWGALYLAGIYLAGALAEALGLCPGRNLLVAQTRRVTARVLKNPGRRERATAAVRRIYEETRADREAIVADLTGIRAEREVRLEAKRKVLTEGGGA